MSVTATQLLQTALSELPLVKPGTVFIAKDLFKGHEWTNFDKGARLTLGTLFFETIKSNPQYGIRPLLDKTSSNQQKYEKLDPAKNGTPNA